MSNNCPENCINCLLEETSDFEDEEYYVEDYQEEYDNNEDGE